MKKANTDPKTLNGTIDLVVKLPRSALRQILDGTKLRLDIMAEQPRKKKPKAKANKEK